jgi:primary-amine oxidase
MPSSAILAVDWIPPNKTEAYAYMNGAAPSPARWAKATIRFGAFKWPYVQDIMIGPLPVTPKTTWAPFNYASNKGGGSKIRVFDADADALYKVYLSRQQTLNAAGNTL